MDFSEIKQKVFAETKKISDVNFREVKMPVVNKSRVMGILIIVIIIVIAVAGRSVVETVESGHYNVIQYPVTGKMRAVMKPGMYIQAFGDVHDWPVAETYYFTADKEEGARADESIEVRFVDGSQANISGTCRVVLPTDPDKAIDLITKYGYKDFDDLSYKLVLPTLRNALRQTANMMTARESYAEKRPEYKDWARDQVVNGLYQTVTEGRTVIDPITQEKTVKEFKVIKKDKNGMPLRVINPLADAGISLANFEIKQFVYKGKVDQQIARQQENLMAIATARAEAERAEQEAKTREAKGKADVMEVRYEMLKEKERAVISAEKEKAVAELQAKKKLEVAKLDKLAAVETKQRLILEGEGEAEKKKLVLQADGALAQKLSTFETVNKWWANAYANRKVPSYYLAGGGENQTGNLDIQSRQFMNLLNAMMAKNLGLDLNIRDK